MVFAADDDVRTRLEPVFIEHSLACAFKAKPCGLCGKPKSNAVHRKKNQQEGKSYCAFKRQNGCLHCGKAKNDPDHLGAPETFNLFAGRDVGFAYDGAKARWQKVLGPLLEGSGLPRGLARVLVEGECSFGDARPRDQGNHRVVLEKALGDILQELGYVANDDWDSYQFGNLARVEEPGVNRIRLVIFPYAPELHAPPAQATLDVG